jgi:hypothetical protein
VENDIDYTKHTEAELVEMFGRMAHVDVIHQHEKDRKSAKHIYAIESASALRRFTSRVMRPVPSIVISESLRIIYQSRLGVKITWQTGVSTYNCRGFRSLSHLHNTKYANRFVPISQSLWGQSGR